MQFFLLAKKIVQDTLYIYLSTEYIHYASYVKDFFCWDLHLYKFVIWYLYQLVT